MSMPKWPVVYVTTLAALPATHCVADTVTLTNGDILNGTVTDQNDQTVTLTHPVLGDIVLPAEQVQAVAVTPAEGEDIEASTEPAATGAVVPPATEEPPPNLNPDSLSQKILPGWDKHFELGFTGSDGNSQTLNIHSGFSAIQEDDYKRWNLDMSYLRNQDDGMRTRNEFTTEIVRDWLMPDSPWFKFASGKYEYDEFQTWESRASAFVGVGKVLKDTDIHKLTGRVGIGGSYEFGSVNEIVPEALLGLEWDYKINDRQSLKSYVTVFPDLDEFGESRTLAGTAWTIKIDEADGLSLKFGIDNEYDSKTEGDSKHNDVTYYGALVFDF